MEENWKRNLIIIYVQERVIVRYLAVYPLRIFPFGGL